MLNPNIGAANVSANSNTGGTGSTGRASRTTNDAASTPISRASADEVALTGILCPETDESTSVFLNSIDGALDDGVITAAEEQRLVQIGRTALGANSEGRVISFLDQLSTMSPTDAANLLRNPAVRSGLLSGNIG